jgi:hypothetical protein
MFAPPTAIYTHDPGRSKNDLMVSDPRLITFPYFPLITLGSIRFVFETNMHFSNFHYNITQFNLM